jgi:hypothetical protein
MRFFVTLVFVAGCAADGHEPHECPPCPCEAPEVLPLPEPILEVDTHPDPSLEPAAGEVEPDTDVDTDPIVLEDPEAQEAYDRAGEILERLELIIEGEEESPPSPVKLPSE